MQGEIVFLENVRLTLNQDGKSFTREDVPAGDFGDVHFGTVAIKVVDRDNQEPIRYTNYWIINGWANRKYWDQEIGLKVDYQSGRGWVRGDFTGRGILYRTVSTYAGIMEQEPIPPPKTRVETRYRYGRWEKYLKSKGWVPA